MLALKKPSGKQITPGVIDTFCSAVLRGEHHSGAYRIAFPPSLKWTNDTVKVRACEFTKRPAVQQRMAELRATLEKTTVLTLDRWQVEVDRCALMDPRKLFDTHGNPLDIPLLGDDEAPCIAGFEISEEFSGKGEDRVSAGYTRKFKLVDKLKALELAGKARGYYTEKSKVEVGITVEHLVSLIKRKEPIVING